MYKTDDWPDRITAVSICVLLISDSLLSFTRKLACGVCGSSEVSFGVAAVLVIIPEQILHSVVVSMECSSLCCSVTFHNGFSEVPGWEEVVRFWLLTARPLTMTKIMNNITLNFNPAIIVLYCSSVAFKLLACTEGEKREVAVQQKPFTCHTRSSYILILNVSCTLWSNKVMMNNLLKTPLEKHISDVN